MPGKHGNSIRTCTIPGSSSKKRRRWRRDYRGREGGGEGSNTTPVPRESG